MVAHVSWHEAAACQDCDPDMFFPDGRAGFALRQAEEAKEICRVWPATMGPRKAWPRWRSPAVPGWCGRPAPGSPRSRWLRSPPASFIPGQFAMVYLEAIDGWHRHPFTITSAPGGHLLSFAIKALGDGTSQLPAAVQPGMPAVIRGPFGRFSHQKGTSRQVWIAGGIGVTPFLSWLRAIDEQPLRGRVD